MINLQLTKQERDYIESMVIQSIEDMGLGEMEHIEPMEKLLKKIQEQTYPRVCSVTGDGMYEGFVWNDGEMHFAYEKDLIKHIKSLNDETDKGLSNEELLEKSYEEGHHYYTEWEEK